MEPTRDGLRKIQRWERAIENVEYKRQQLNSAECELTNATNDLGKWLLPNDAKKGETIAVWHGDELICTTKKDNQGSNFTVESRKR